jgi:hypothetical protein
MSISSAIVREEFWLLNYRKNEDNILIWRDIGINEKEKIT